MAIEPYAPSFEGWRGPWNFAAPDETEERLRAAGFAEARAWLQERPVTPDDPHAYLTEINLGAHLERLPERAAPALRRRGPRAPRRRAGDDRLRAAEHRRRGVGGAVVRRRIAALRSAYCAHRGEGSEPVVGSACA